MDQWINESIVGRSRSLSSGEGVTDKDRVVEHPEVPTLFDVQEMELNFGPQHPSTHGVLRLVLKVDGEKILEAKPDVGYLHRGTEKLFETETYPMGIPHTDRMDYVAAATNNHQELNARVMERAGAAIVITEKELTPEALAAAVGRIEPQKMGAAAKVLAAPEATKKIVDTIEKII